MTNWKKMRFWALALAIFMVVPMSARVALSAKFKAFSADQVVLDADGNVEYTGKMYMAGDKMRMEQNLGETSKKMIMIMRRDKKLMWALDPKKKIYVQMPLDEEKWKEQAEGYVKSEDTKTLGKETVNGYRCVKKQITRKMEVMGMKMTTTQTIWVSDEIGMPIRTRSGDGMVTELRNIKEGQPPAGVFEIPPGYKKIGGDMGALFMAMEGMEMPPMPQQSGGQGEMKLPFKLPEGMKLPFGGSD